jgi:hypothetical protein
MDKLGIEPCIVESLSITSTAYVPVLGNLDPHNWSSQDCFAPVLSALETRLLISIAVQKKRIPKTGDFVPD